ncbi:MAG: potassium-transporting ATPase subunit C [Thermoplasmata archaeon]|nr:potassium-transporting ATPase subunit C [Thermoplasmata archaeon]
MTTRSPPPGPAEASQPAPTEMGPDPASPALDPAPSPTPTPTPTSSPTPVEPSPEPLDRRMAPEPPFRLPSLRASLLFVVFLLVVGGLGYPIAVTAFAQYVTPGTANGSLVVAANGTVIASELLGQNITNASLFWLRPSLIDDQPFTGAGNETPYGPTNPELRNLTLYYIAQYGLANVSVPVDLVTPSESGLDPDITPESALVQVPRVAAHTGLSQAYLTTLVQAWITSPTAGLFGPSYVNVLDLDRALLASLGR